MNRLAQLWLTLRSSLWFAPALLVLGAIALAIALIEIDLRVPVDGDTVYRPLLTTSAEGARAMLAAIAGSMMTVAGVVFSITIVTLSLASSQYSPRVLRGFMKDSSNQVVLGVFVGIFTYCIVVLGAIRTDYVEFVPSIAVLVGAMLSLVGVAFLIHFIHHTATAIQVSSIVATVATETEEAIARAYPGTDSDLRPEVPIPAGPWIAVAAPKTGYVQRLDEDALAVVAVDLHTVLRLERRVGDFVVASAPLVWIRGAREPDEKVRARIMRAISIGRQRTVEQDPAWGLRQIADIAARALSPGINDPTTAITCVQYLGALLGRLARVRLPNGQTFVDRELRLVVPATPYAEMLSVALDDVRHSASGHPAVLAALFDCLEGVGAAAESEAGAAVRETFDAVRELVGRSVHDPLDRSRLLARADQDCSARSGPR